MVRPTTITLDQRRDDTDGLEPMPRSRRTEVAEPKAATVTEKRWTPTPLESPEGNLGVEFASPFQYYTRVTDQTVSCRIGVVDRDIFSFAGETICPPLVAAAHNT
jgi:hypothetical protein